MQKTEVCAEIPRTTAGVVIITIVRVTSSCWREGRAISYSGTKQPTGVIVISPSYKKGFKISGEEVPLEHFIQEVPGLKIILENYQSKSLWNE